MIKNKGTLSKDFTRMPVSGFKGVVFDLDGTLANTFRDLSASMNAMLISCGYPTRSDDELLKLINGGVKIFVGRSIPVQYWEDEAEIRRCIKIYNDYYNQNYCTRTVLYDGMYEALHEIHDRGIKIALNTNKDEDQAKKIVDTLIPGVFDIVLGLGRFPAKPDPAGSLYIAAKLGLSPEEIMFVGDSNVDMETACNAGMFAVGVEWGYRSKEILIESGAKRIAGLACELVTLACGKEQPEKN